MSPQSVKLCGKAHPYCAICSPDTPGKVGRGVKGKRKGLPVAANLLPRTPEWNANISKGLTGKKRKPYGPITESRRQAIILGTTGKPKSASHVERMRKWRPSEATKERMAEGQARRIKYQPRFTRTQPQLKLATFLENAGFIVELEVQFGRYCIDIYLPDYHLAFEADGDFWHSLPRSQEHDKKRDAWLWERHRLPVVRLWQREIATLG